MLEEMGVEKQAQRLLASMHDGSWFVVGDDPDSDVLEVRKGSRQGCRFGGMVFNLCYGRLQNKFRARVIERGIAMQTEVAGSMV